MRVPPRSQPWSNSILLPALATRLALYIQAKRGHAPLVVIGGDAGVKYMNMDAQMAADLVAMMEPVTKYSTMVLHPASLLRTLRRAIKIAATPPMGPVYVCLPQDILDAEVTEEVYPTLIPSTRVVPDTASIRQLAEGLASARKPVIFIGDGVAYSGASLELTRVAELLGAEVWEADAGELNMAYTHPLYMGMTGHMFGQNSLPLMQKGDANLIVGTYILPEVFPELGEVFAKNAQVYHIDLNAYEIAKNHRVDVGVVADPKTDAGIVSPGTGRNADQRTKGLRQSTDQRNWARPSLPNWRKPLKADRAGREAVPLKMARFMEELAPHLPKDAIIFDEALTSSPAVVRYFQPTTTGQYFLTRGGSLGVGFPGAIGAKLANPEKTVIGFSGDGGSMYTIQALWTAARHNVNAKFVVCNNASYRLLQLNINEYWKEQDISKHDFPLSFDLSYPPLHFVELAKGMGVPGVRVEKPWEIASAVQQMLAAPGPFLVDLVLESDTHPERVGNTCGQ